MKKIIGILLVGLWGLSMPSMAQHHLLLESPAFASNSAIPVLYTCKGGDHSPPLVWKDAYGSDTQSFVLTVEDPDALTGVWDHWVLYNIPPIVRQLAEDGNSTLPSGLNSWGTPVYRGPCPPQGTHRYIFTLYSKCSEKYTYKSKIRTVKLSTFKKGGVVDVEIRSSLLGRDIHSI